jgi:hypothetical protein
MKSRSGRVFHILLSEMDHLLERGEASDEDCIAACVQLCGHLVAAAAFTRGDTPEQEQFHIARTKKMLEAAIRGSSLALRRAMAEEGA